jgi:mono/diheme cytochrome c family protein
MAAHAIRFLLILGFVAMTAGAACAQPRAAERRGEAILSQKCAMCHAIGRSGRSPHAVAPPFRTLSRRYPLEALEEALGEGLMTGHPDMPEFVFQPHEIGAIIAYLRSIQER